MVLSTGVTDSITFISVHLGMVINGHELVPAEIKVLDLTVVSFHRMVAVVFYVHT